MRKKIVIIGLVLIAAAFLISFLLSYVNPFMYINTKIPAGGFLPINFSIPSNKTPVLFAFLGRFNKSINLYSFNSTAFQKWAALAIANPENGLAYAESMEGNGTFAILTNVTSIALGMSYSRNLTNATIVYSSNKSISNETEVIVMQSTKGITNASIAYIPPITQYTLSKYPNISHAFAYISIGSVSGIIMFIAGIMLVIFGLIKKPKAKEAEKQSVEELKERDLLYSKLSAKEKPMQNKSTNKKPHANAKNAKPKQKPK